MEQDQDGAGLEGGNEEVGRKLQRMVFCARRIESEMAPLVKDGAELPERIRKESVAMAVLLAAAEAKEAQVALIEMIAGSTGEPAVEVQCHHSSGWPQCWPRKLHLDQLLEVGDLETLEEERRQHQREMEHMMAAASHKEGVIQELGRRKMAVQREYEGLGLELRRLKRETKQLLARLPQPGIKRTEARVDSQPR
eukprot:TRINITY_DN60652_c0_g1_i1.p1 TRINITY_DN60652_c0_g1~~TRINITY_DN60652_c0_g1_i1.p1  ORF type:complete len:195 (+),score=44.52 TRINITY_DN60652_c0_g1_i1:34-618(+)